MSSRRELENENGASTLVLMKHLLRDIVQVFLIKPVFSLPAKFKFTYVYCVPLPKGLKKPILSQCEPFAAVGNWFPVTGLELRHFSK